MRGLIDDVLLGAGNVSYWLRDCGADLTSPRIFLDRPWFAPDGVSRTNLSLTDILSCASAYRHMYRELGVGSDDVVAIHIRSPVDVYLHWVALAAEGAIAAPVNPNLSSEIVMEYGRRIGAAGILIEASRASDPGSPAAELRWHQFTGKELLKSKNVTVRPSNAQHESAYSHDTEDVILLCHTSGTTGQPKAVSASHQGFMVGILSELRQPASPLFGSTMLSALPAAHLSSLSTITWALLSGTKLIIASDQSALTVVDDVERFRPDCITSFSCTLREVARLNLHAGAMDSVSLWMTTGDASRRRDIAMVSALGTHPATRDGVPTRAPGMFVLDCFGSSELGYMHFCVLHPPGHTLDARCIGRPASFVTAAILGEDGEELPEDRVGYLAVQSGSVTSGYWNDPERTSASRRGSFWMTGDVGYRDRFGRYFHLDRQSDVIETESGRVYSVRSEEELLRAIPEIERCAIVERRGKDGVVQAVCLIEPNVSYRSARDWHRDINSVLTDASLLPVAEAIVVSTGTLPLGPTGKIRKFRAREQLQSAGIAWLK